jgi:hypothetical protein
MPTTSSGWICLVTQEAELTGPGDHVVIFPGLSRAMSSRGVTKQVSLADPGAS